MSLFVILIPQLTVPRCYEDMVVTVIDLADSYFRPNHHAVYNAYRARFSLLHSVNLPFLPPLTWFFV